MQKQRSKYQWKKALPTYFSSSTLYKLNHYHQIIIPLSSNQPNRNLTRSNHLTKSRLRIHRDLVPGSTKSNPKTKIRCRNILFFASLLDQHTSWPHFTVNLSFYCCRRRRRRRTLMHFTIHIGPSLHQVHYIKYPQTFPPKKKKQGSNIFSGKRGKTHLRPWTYSLLYFNLLPTQREGNMGCGGFIWFVMEGFA